MDRDEIMVVERPESVSWEEISGLLRRAHAQNVANGIKLPYPFLAPEELKAKTEGEGGKMLVALLNGKLVGTAAIKVISRDNFWFGGGDFAYCFLAAVSPECTGRGVYRRLVEAREHIARDWGVNRLLFDTDERNARVMEIMKKNGFRAVDYRIREDHNSIIFVKWLNGSPYSKLKCAYVFWRRKSDRLKKAKRQNAAANQE